MAAASSCCRCWIINGSEHLRHVLLIEVAKAAKRLNRVFDEALRHGRAQIFSHIGGYGWNCLRISDIAAHPLAEWGICAREIDVRVQLIYVPGGVAEWELRLAVPEQTVVNHRYEIIAFELLRIRHACGIDCQRGAARSPQAGYFFINACPAQVGHLTVEFVPAGVHREERLRLESGLDVIVDKLRPSGAFGRCW